MNACIHDVYLVGNWFMFSDLTNPFNLRNTEVGHTERFGQAQVDEFFHSLKSNSTSFITESIV